jgi:hypothetical protein
MRPTGATLVGTKHEELMGQPVWPLAFIPSGEFRSITVEMNATEVDAYRAPSP